MEASESDYRGTVAPSPFDCENMSAIIGGKLGDWFSADLLRLIAKADKENRELLRKVYPNHVKAYEDWHG